MATWFYEIRPGTEREAASFLEGAALRSCYGIIFEHTLDTSTDVRFSFKVRSRGFSPFSTDVAFNESCCRRSRRSVLKDCGCDINDTWRLYAVSNRLFEMPQEPVTVRRMLELFVMPGSCTMSSFPYESRFPPGMRFASSLCRTYVSLSYR